MNGTQWQCTSEIFGRWIVKHMTYPGLQKTMVFRKTITGSSKRPSKSCKRGSLNGPAFVIRPHGVTPVFKDGWTSTCPVAPPKNCGQCLLPGGKTAGCFMVLYCSRKCQKNIGKYTDLLAEPTRKRSRVLYPRLGIQTAVCYLSHWYLGWEGGG